MIYEEERAMRRKEGRGGRSNEEEGRGGKSDEESEKIKKREIKMKSKKVARRRMVDHLGPFGQRPRRGQ